MDDIFDYYGIPEGMEDIGEQYAKAKAEYERLQKVLLEAREEQQRKKVADITPMYAAMYTKKLERLKVYADGFRDESRGREVKFGFRKVEPYVNDYHDPTYDPLDWRLCEYDLLEMSQHLEIVFDYSNDGVKKFVCDWMEKNMDYAYEDSRLENGYFWKE